jgi:hypothetical protein
VTAGIFRHKQRKIPTSNANALLDHGTGEHKALWQECCTAHDLAYWQGGSYQQRLQADRQLQQCVTKVGQKDIARLMLAGVRVGGTPVLPTSFRWGYGWPYPRGYRDRSGNRSKHSYSDCQSNSAAVLPNINVERLRPPVTLHHVAGKYHLHIRMKFSAISNTAVS